MTAGYGSLAVQVTEPLGVEYTPRERKDKANIRLSSSPRGCRCGRLSPRPRSEWSQCDGEIVTLQRLAHTSKNVHHIKILTR